MNKKEVIKKILKYYAITRIFLIILMIVDDILLKAKYPGEFQNIFYVFDGEHYINIANNGYVADYLFAFFPTVPLLIRCLGRGFLLLNQLFVMLTAYLLYLIGYKHLKLEDPMVPVKFFMISPISIMTMIYYTEATFLFLTVLSYYLYKEKKHYLILGIVLGLCSTVRSTGSILFFALFILMAVDLFKKNIKIKNIFITYIPATLISCTYPIYLYFKAGNPFEFIRVQKYWYKTSSNIFRILYDIIVKTISDYRFIWAVNSILTVVIIYVFIKYIVNNRKEKQYYGLFTYFILTIIMICFSIKNTGDPVTSYYRYIYACFPVYFMVKDELKNYMLTVFFTINVANFFLLNGYFF